MTELLVVTVAAALIYRIGRTIYASTRHISDDDLVDYWSGALKLEDPAAHRRCSEHLGTCAACRERLDEVRRTEAGPGANSPLIERKY